MRWRRKRRGRRPGVPQGAPRCFFGGVCTCRAGPMCPAAGYAFFGGARGPRPTGRYVEPRVGDGVSTSRPCHSEPVLTLAWESVSPRLPLRGRCQREALTEGERPRAFLSPSRLRRQPPPRGGLTARHRRAVIARRAAPWQSVPRPQISVKITTIPCQILCTHTKCKNFAGNGCGSGGEVLCSHHTS